MLNEHTGTLVTAAEVAGGLIQATGEATRGSGR